MTRTQDDAQDRTARRARRLARWWGGTTVPAPPTGGPRPVDAADAWFDAWLAEGVTDGTGTAEALRTVTAHGWTVLHQLHRPGRASATVEHVAVGPGGVVLIETLRGHGDVAVVDRTLRVRGYGRTPDVAAVADAASALTALLAPTHRRTVSAVLCLSGQDLAPVAVAGGAVAVGEGQLAGHLLGLPELLPAADVPLVAEYLEAELAGDASPEQLTVDDVFRPSTVWRHAVAPEAGEQPGDVDDASAAWPGRQRAASRDVPLNGERGTTGAAPAAQDGGAAGVGRAGRSRARGDGLLRTAALACALATAGNLLLGWLSQAG